MLPQPVEEEPPGPQPITATQKWTSTGGGSYTPPAGKVLLALIAGKTHSSGPGSMSVTGHGQTWTLVGETWTGGGHYVGIFRADTGDGSAATGTTLAVTMGNGLTAALHGVYELGGDVDDAAPIVRAVTTTGSATSTPTVNLGGQIDPGSAVLGLFKTDTSDAASAGSGLTLLHNGKNGTYEAVGAVFKDSFDGSVDVSFPSPVNAFAGIAIEIASTLAVGDPPGAITTAVRRGSGTMSAASATLTAAVSGMLGGPAGGILTAVVIVCSKDGAEAPGSVVITGVGTAWTKRGEFHTWQSSYSHKMLVYTCADHAAGAGTVTVTFPAAQSKFALVMVDEIPDADTYIQGRGFTNASSNAASLLAAPAADSLVYGAKGSTANENPTGSTTTVMVGSPVNVADGEGRYITADTAYKPGTAGDTLNFQGSTAEAWSFVSEIANDA